MRVILTSRTVLRSRRESEIGRREIIMKPDQKSELSVKHSCWGKKLERAFACPVERPMNKKSTKIGF